MNTKNAGYKSLDPQEVNKFTSFSHAWWTETGPYAILHRINITRLQYISAQICSHFNRILPLSLTDLTILDVGCGGGIVCEPLYRLGGTITGIDAGQENIDAARHHAEGGGLSIAYECATAEAWAESQKTYDVVLALEIIEHVADLQSFLSACGALVKPGGLLIVSTLNRTLKSYFLGIVAAEYILRWVPVGTHQWKKFLKPSDLGAYFREMNFHIHDISGMSYLPFQDQWILNKKIDVNYLMTVNKNNN